MPIILNCGSCGKRMGSLEPFVIEGDKYLCRSCGSTAKEQKSIREFYETVDVGTFPFIGFWKKPEYRVFIRNGFNFKNTVPIIQYPAPSYADQFDNNTYLILAYDDHWCVYDGRSNRVLDALPHTFNGFNAYSEIYITTVIARFV